MITDDPIISTRRTWLTVNGVDYHVTFQDWHYPGGWHDLEDIETMPECDNKTLDIIEAELMEYCDSNPL